MSLLLRSGFGWSLKRSPRNSASDRPRFWSMTPMEPSKITIRCLNSRSRRSWTDTFTATGPLRVQRVAFSGSDWAPDLESAIVVKHMAAAAGQLVDGGEALGWVGGAADVGLVIDHHIAGGVEFVRKVVDRVAVGEPNSEAVVGRDR